jgi:L,D-peptidoglycan transpeptidase YkuD (ErfK/YbiS/YcfS/YnhG family)
MASSAALRRIAVVPSPIDRSRGLLAVGGSFVPCALGRTGIARRKREGDGATPAGTLRPVLAWWRPDRVARPVTRLPTAPIRADSGWCDDPADRSYNRPVRLPFAAGHERLWRDDRLYDLCVLLDWNLDRPVSGAGSAIFLHLAAPGVTPTAGCIAVSEPAMRRLLWLASADTYFDTG